MNMSLRKKFTDGTLSPEEEEALLRDDPDLQLELMASMYVDGELSADEASQFERALLSDPALQARLESFEVLAALANERAPEEGDAEDSEEETAETSKTAESSNSDRNDSADDGPSASVVDLTSRRRARPMAGWLAASAVAAATIAIIVTRELPTIPLKVDVVPSEGGPVLRSAASDGKRAKQGDRLDITVSIPDKEHWALRVYRAGQPMPALSCPGQSECGVESGVLRASVELRAWGTYEVAWIRSPSPVPAPGGSLEKDAAMLPSDSVFNIRTVDVR